MRVCVGGGVGVDVCVVTQVYCSTSLHCSVLCIVLYCFHVVNGNTISRVLLAVVVSLSILRKITTAGYMCANILI